MSRFVIFILISLSKILKCGLYPIYSMVFCPNQKVGKTVIEMLRLFFLGGIWIEFVKEGLSFSGLELSATEV